MIVAIPCSSRYGLLSGPQNSTSICRATKHCGKPSLPRNGMNFYRSPLRTKPGQIDCRCRHGQALINLGEIRLAASHTPLNPFSQFILIHTILQSIYECYSSPDTPTSSPNPTSDGETSDCCDAQELGNMNYGEIHSFEGTSCLVSCRFHCMFDCF